MDKTQVIIFVAAMSFLAFRIYQKYFKKDGPGKNVKTNKPSDNEFLSSSKEDDYEPYSKK